MDNPLFTVEERAAYEPFVVVAVFDNMMEARDYARKYFFRRVIDWRVMEWRQNENNVDITYDLFPL